MADYLVEGKNFFRKEISVFANMTDSFLSGSFLSSGVWRGVVMNFELLKIKVLANLIKACLQNTCTECKQFPKTSELTSTGLAPRLTSIMCSY
jgi:hypothetical protein